MKKILIVSRSFYPENSPRSFRTTELAKEFAKQGHEVTVLTFKDDRYHNEFEKQYGITIKGLPKYMLPEIKLKGSGWMLYFRRAMRRLLNLFFEYPDIQLAPIVKRALKKESGYDILISIAVPHPVHWGVAYSAPLKNKVAKLWVADCGDPYMGSKHDSFNKLFYFQFLENFFLKRADYVTVPFEEMKLLFNQEYIDKFRVIPQGFNLNEIHVSREQPANDVPTFIYAGTVMPGSRDPFTLLNFLIEQKKDFKFIIYTGQKQLFSKYTPILNGKLLVKDCIPRIQLLNEMSKADFLVNIDTDSNNGVINAIPSKLIDYTLSGRPILSYEQSKFNHEILLGFLNGNYSKAYNIPDFEKYRIENVCKQFLHLLENK